LSQENTPEAVLGRRMAAFFLPNRALPDIRCGRFQPLPAERAAWSAAIAQLVEHVIRNDGVTGSSPVCGTNSWRIISN
jgi:hypothetical protein